MEYLSKEGLERLKSELQNLKTVRRREIAERLKHAKSLGDLSENAEYQEAKEAQSMLEAQITKLEERIKTAVIIEEGRLTDIVMVGSTVKVRSHKGENTYKIVGSQESNPAEGKISNESPLGKAFLGRKVGDKTEVKTPGGGVTYEILDIF